MPTRLRQVAYSIAMWGAMGAFAACGTDDASIADAGLDAQFIADISVGDGRAEIADATSADADWNTTPIPPITQGAGPPCRNGACPAAAAWCCQATDRLAMETHGTVHAGDLVCTGDDDDLPLYCVAHFGCVPSTCAAGTVCCAFSTTTQLSGSSCQPEARCVSGGGITYRALCGAGVACAGGAACVEKTCLGITFGFCGTVPEGWCD